MSDFDTVSDLAKEALTVHMPTGELDHFIWDRSQRLVHTVEAICEIPELASRNIPIDHAALVSATYFSDAGLARYLGMGRKERQLTFSEALNDGLLDFCTTVVEEKLTGVFVKTKIEKINRIISESRGNFTKMTEAMILSDARNLDDMGAVGIFNEFKRIVSEGKGVGDVLQIWERKIDYRYWQARLEKNFRFESVHKLAEQKLATAEYFMEQLKAETESHDLRKVVVEPLMAK